ncbi:MAG: methyltransferase domain-containing protein [Candidatus Odinarchaeota archaeon]
MVFKEFKISATKEFWDHHWSNISIVEALSRVHRQARLFNLMRTYLPKNARILEAGCGNGQFVFYLRQYGYDVYGIDYAEETVNKIRSVIPTAPISIGNILSLDYSDNSLGGYISLGVIEHFEDGPYRALKEAHRVLKPRGTLFLTVPYINFSRLVSIKWRKLIMEGSGFYQYYFDKNEIIKVIRSCGFDIIATHPLDSFTGFRRLIKSYININQNRKKFTSKKSENENKNENKKNNNLMNQLFYQIAARLFENPIVEKVFGHIILIIGHKAT